MKTIITLLFSIPFFVLAQNLVTPIEWSVLEVKEFEKVISEELHTEVNKPIFTDEQLALDSTEVIISGNYHVLNSFDSKTYLLSKDEIIKTPMQRDEIIILDMVADPKIYFGRKVKVRGTLIISKDLDAESIYVLTNVQKVK